MVAIQKCSSTSAMLGASGPEAEQARDQVVREPVDTMATNRTPECTWPTISRCGDRALTVLIDLSSDFEGRACRRTTAIRSGTRDRGRCAAYARHQTGTRMPLIMPPPREGASRINENTMPTDCAQSPSGRLTNAKWCGSSTYAWRSGTSAPPTNKPEAGLPLERYAEEAVVAEKAPFVPYTTTTMASVAGEAQLPSHSRLNRRLNTYLTMYG